MRRAGARLSIDGDGSEWAARSDHTDVGHESALVGAVTATLTVVLGTAVAMVATALWSLAEGGAASWEGLTAALAFIGLSSAIAMVASYVLGIPVAFVLERHARAHPRWRFLLYGAVGGGVGALVGLWIGGGRLVGVLGGSGLLAALGGGAGARRAGAWPEAIARRRGLTGAAVLTAAALLGWLASGLVFIPLLAAALVGGLALVISAAFRPPFVHRPPER